METNYCLFYKGSQILFGLLLCRQKNKWIVQPLAGRQFHAPTNQLPLCWQDKAFNDVTEGLKALEQRAAQVATQAKALDLETIHQLLEPGQPYGLTELAELFLDQPEQGWSRAALLLALKNNPLKFQSKKDQFVARSPEEIERLCLEEKKKQEAVEKEAREQAWCQSLAQGIAPEILPEQSELWKQFKKTLLHFSLHFEKAAAKDHLAPLLGLDLTQPRIAENQLLRILNLTGEKKSWGRLLLERNELCRPWSPDILQEAQALAASNPAENIWGLEMTDLRHLPALTIDNATTKDYDDALSAQLEGENLRLWVHIACVGGKIGPQSPLFKLAQTRISSLYTPLAVYPMLPEVLNEETFSLLQGAPKGALTLECLLSPSGEVLQSQLYPTVIQVEQNLSYETMDQRIAQGEAPWAELSRFTQALAQKRKQAGALELSRREVQLDLSDPKQVRIAQYRIDSPASLMVQETAILANAQVADYCLRKGIPSLYRNQPPYELLRDPSPTKPLQLKDLRIQPAKLGPTAEGHAALGLSAYLQVTSPIRRFLDLLTQCQILAEMAGQPLGFHQEDLLGWALEIEARSKALAQTERRLLDHWKIKYLAQNSAELYTGAVQRRLRNGRWLVRLVELELPIEMDLLKEKEEVKIRLRQVRPEEDYIDAVEADPLAPQSEQQHRNHRGQSLEDQDGDQGT